jgi:two-component system LytT family response regulator
MKLNCVVVDDSAIQRMTVTKLVANHPNLNLVGDFSNAMKLKIVLPIKKWTLFF